MSYEPLDQAGSEGSIDPRTGLIELNLKYSVGTLAECQTFKVPSKDNPWGLPEFGPRRFSQLEGIGDWMLTINLKGGGDQDFDGTWEINFASEQKPIECFPDWPNFAKKYGAIPDEKTKQFTGFKQKIILGGQSVPNPAYGIDNYLSPKAVVTVDYNRKQLDHSIWRNLGKIDTPRLPGGFTLPDLAGGRNFIKHSAAPVDRGNVVGHRIVWWLSDEGGWLFDLYAPRR